MSTFPTYVMPPEPRMQDDEGNMDWEAFRFWQRACRDREEALWPYYHPPTESSFSSSSSTRGLPTPDPSDHGHHPEPSQPAGGTVPLFLYPPVRKTSPKEDSKKSINPIELWKKLHFGVNGAKIPAQRVVKRPCGPTAKGIYQNTRSRKRQGQAFAELGPKYEMIITGKGLGRIDGPYSYVTQGRKKTKAHEFLLLWGHSDFPVVKQDEKLNY